MGGAIALALVSAACSSSPGNTGKVQSPANAPSSAASAPLLLQIQAEIGNAACSSNEQCHTLALGSKACGGAERYLAWSTKDGKGDRLVRLAEDYAAARRAEDERDDMMSTCQMVIDPGAVCRQQRCILLPRGPGAGGVPQY
jgi:hypothetical protein